MEQRSAEWYAARCGNVTASRISDVIARTKTGWGASRHNYMAQLVTERLTGAPSEGYVSKPMQWGIDTEPEARAAYEFYAGVTVDEVGFIVHPRLAQCGASPDGHVGAEGSTEMKCPNTATHIELLLSGIIDSNYLNQMQFQMACSGRKWCDFVSYDPRMPEELKLFVRRVYRDDNCITKLEDAAVEFLEEVDTKVKQLLNLKLSLPEAA